ncbi:MAG TPA: hypothetical protein VGA37_02755 [Gemmatimonadales bacterium]
MMSRLAVLLLGCWTVVPGAVAAQEVDDPNVPRPPYLLALTRAERIEAAVQLFLAEFMQAIQTADTLKLSMLVEDELIPAGEKPVSQRAGCPSLGRALQRLRAARAGLSDEPRLPLRMIRLGDVATTLSVSSDTVARVSARLKERTDRAVLYAPIAFVFALDGDLIRLGATGGLLVGTCGFAEAR